ncbi:hypothetical protein BBAD15_g5140 [Beauveria bassiana D1-5]|uniref:Uncharacterized protein n=1 Tax=Beauveria bassiana D1-5 TaxID=1245745 RepID=A0A0A2W956_BEABA|nr:hypothetical protein BBAD15_g5140 [Beauveria bassiana D1-5]
MASLIPFISEILPMIMPASTHVTAAKDLRPAHPTVEGPVIRRAAVVDRCDKMCASGKLDTTSSHAQLITPPLPTQSAACPGLFLRPNATTSSLPPARPRGVTILSSSHNPAPVSHPSAPQQ